MARQTTAPPSIERKRPGSARPGAAARLPIALMLAAGLWGCAVATDPTSESERLKRAQADQAAMFVAQSPVSRPLTVYDAMARAIKYNHEHRLRAMEAALAVGLAEIASYDLLPQITTSAGYTARNNDNASSSQSVSTGQTSLVPSISQESQRVTANLGVAWNVLDFGVSYLRARQQSNQALVAEERRRKVVHNIIQQVRNAYWRAVAAERLEADLDPLIKKIETALGTSRKIEEKQLQPPSMTLDYKRALLDTLRQLQLLRRDIASAKLELAGLMNLPSDQPLRLAPAEATMLPQITTPVEQLEILSLVNRPELREEDYQARISADEVRKSIAKMLPGLELDFTGNYDSNKFLVNHLWAEGGIKLTWNLINLISGPASVKQAENQQAFADMRRRAMHMAVLTQVRVGYLRQREANEEFRVADELSKTDEKLYQLAVASTAAAASDELELIRRDANRLFSRARRDLAYADLQNAVGSLGVAVGVDPLPSELAASDVDSLSTALQRVMSDWDAGQINLRALPPPPAPPPAAPAPTPAPATVPAPVSSPMPGPKPAPVPAPATPGRRAPTMTAPAATPAPDATPAPAPAPARPPGLLDDLQLLPGTTTTPTPAPAPEPKPARQSRASARVEQPASPAAVAAPSTATPGEGSLQLGSFHNRENAMAEWEGLRRAVPELDK